MGVSLGFPKGPQHPFGTRLCLQSLVCYTLVPADAEKGLREAPASTCSAAEDARMGVAVDGLCPPSADLQRNQWCTFSFLPQQRSPPCISSTLCRFFEEYFLQRLCIP